MVDVVASHPAVPADPAPASDPAARSRALSALLLGDGQVGTDEIAAWAVSVVAAGAVPSGWDPASLLAKFPCGWRAALANAGVPLARGGIPWTARLDESAFAPTLTSTGVLQLPPLARFATLTSLPLKPVRVLVHIHTGVRLQVAAGVHLWLWENQVALVNVTSVHRSGFIHGPRRGMRSVVALDPGHSQVITW